MNEANLNRVKRRLLQEAVAENLDTIRGGPPRNLRPRERRLRLWLRRAPFLLVPLILAGSTWMASNTGTQAASASPVVKTSILGAASHRRAAGTPTLEPGVPQPIDTAVFPLSVRRVVLDAGHGGTDPGTMSARKIAEKDITLDIERRLAALLRSGGFEVVQTRSDDRLIPLRERAHLANAASGDIFVSVHVNSIRNPERHGVETYYLGTTTDQAITSLAADENRTSGYSVADMRMLLDGIYADARRDESHRLASAVQDGLYGGLRASDAGLMDWGVKRAPFLVLVATDMPAVLAEVGCLSNEREAAMLEQPQYRQQIADSLFRGIVRYASAGEAPQTQKKGS